MESVFSMGQVRVVLIRWVFGDRLYHGFGSIFPLLSVCFLGETRYPVQGWVITKRDDYTGILSRGLFGSISIRGCGLHVFSFLPFPSPW